MAHSQYDGTTGLPNLLKLIHDMRRLFSAGGVVIGFDIQPACSSPDARTDNGGVGPPMLQSLIGATMREVSAAYDGSVQVYQLHDAEYAVVMGGEERPPVGQVAAETRLALEQSVRMVGLPAISVSHTVVNYPEEAANIADMLTQLHVGLVRTTGRLDAIPMWAVPPVDDLARRFSQTLDNILHLQQLAYVDAVSGLPNHRAAELELADMVKVSEKSNRTFSILFVDGDHLKQYNDAYGYEAGNKLIRAMGSALQRLSRPQDEVYRWLSGDEFLIIVPDTDCDTATAMGEHMRAAMANFFSAWDMAITVSIGVACYPLHGASVGELIQAGTIANMFAKQAGRNCVHTWRSLKA